MQVVPAAGHARTPVILRLAILPAAVRHVQRIAQQRPVIQRALAATHATLTAQPRPATHSAMAIHATPTVRPLRVIRNVMAIHVPQTVPAHRAMFAAAMALAIPDVRGPSAIRNATQVQTATLLATPAPTAIRLATRMPIAIQNATQMPTAIHPATLPLIQNAILNVAATRTIPDVTMRMAVAAVLTTAILRAILLYLHGATLHVAASRTITDVAEVIVSQLPARHSQDVPTHRLDSAIHGCNAVRGSHGVLMNVATRSANPTNGHGVLKDRWKLSRSGRNILP